MTRIWSDRQLERTTPTQAKDIRGKAFLSAVNRMLGDRPLPGPHMRDPETCPAEILPALVAEYSMEEFIEPGLPVHVVRRILKNRWALQSGEGYDSGVKLGLELLGMRASIVQWHEMQPKGAANTHRIDVFMEDVLWPDDDGYFSTKQVTAMWRMIAATKRWSQESELRVGVETRPQCSCGAYPAMRIVAMASTDIPPAPVLTVDAGSALIPSTCIKTEVTAAAVH